MTLNEPNDQMVVLAAIQQKQTEVQKLQAEELDAVREEVRAIRAKTAELQKQLDVDRSTREERMQEWDRRIERLVSGMGAFLARSGIQL
jgi:hypothetical protein